MEINNSEIEVIYEDNHLIAVNKKPSQIVQGDKTGDEPLSEKVKRYLKEKYQKPGEVFVGVVHRLDRPVSGVVLFAKTSKALARMNELFRTREMSKIYWAVVKNAPPKMEDTLVSYLLKDEKNNKSKVVSPSHKKALKAELSYAVIGKSDNYFLLRVEPLTGRHHQIRVQLSAMGCPIKGDVKYGFNRTNKDASIHLHARELAFVHPVKQEPVSIIAEPPAEVVWNAVLPKN